MRSSIVASKRVPGALTLGLALVLVAAPAAAQPEHEADHHDVHESPATPMDALGDVTAAEEDGCGPITSDTRMDAERLACWDGRILGDDITVDLRRLTVRDTQLFIEGSDITVRNGVLDFSGLDATAGVALFAANTSGLTLDRLTVRGFDGAFAVDTGQATTVSRSLFRDNAGVAVSQYYGDELSVTTTAFTGNGRAISIQDGEGARITRNTFIGNGTGVRVWDEGFFGANGTRIAANIFRDNTFGVRIDANNQAQRTVVEGNTILRSRASGIAVTAQTGFGSTSAGDTVIRRNTVTHGGRSPEQIEACEDGVEWVCETHDAADGITILVLDDEVAASITVSRNNVVRNAGHGIYAPGVTDGGKNVAAANGAGTCVGVTCRGR